MTYASKKEALAAVNLARAKAQRASEALSEAYKASQTPPDQMIATDTARLHYDRCIRELEEAINDAGPFETSGDDE